jgi:hypothetical protein
MRYSILLARQQRLLSLFTADRLEAEFAYAKLVWPWSASQTVGRGRVGSAASGSRT